MAQTSNLYLKLFFALATLCAASFYSHKQTNNIWQNSPLVLQSSSERIIATLPFSQLSSNKFIQVSFSGYLKGKAPDSFLLHSLNEIISLKVNGHEAKQEIGSDYKIDLSPYLGEGENSFSVKLKNSANRLSLYLEPQFRTLNNIKILFCFLSALLIWLLTVDKLSNSNAKIFVATFLLGSLVRIVYFIKTPYWLRSYDWPEHLEYIEHFIANSGLPAVEAGWQFYQMPLYYFIASSFSDLTYITLFSLLLSITSLIILLSIGLALSLRDSRFFIYAIFTSLAPPGIFLASRLSNDSLLFFFMLLSFLGLLKFRNSHSPVWFLISAVSAGLASLTKLSGAISILLIVFGLLTMCRSLEKKRLIIGISIALLSALPAHYINSIRNSSHLIGEMTQQTLSPGLEVKEFVPYLNPSEIVANPFAKSWDKESRREYFFEYLFKSFYFGEFEFQEHTKTVWAILLSGLLLFFLLAITMPLRTWTAEDVPPLALILFSFTAILYLRFTYPYSPCQDFRQIAFVLPAFGYLAATDFQVSALRLCIGFIVLSNALASTMLLNILI